MGLIAERATETARRPRADFARCTSSGDRTPYFGPVATGETGMLQLVDVPRLLAEFALPQNVMPFLRSNAF